MFLNLQFFLQITLNFFMCAPCMTNSVRNLYQPPNLLLATWIKSWLHPQLNVKTRLCSLPQSSTKSYFVAPRIVAVLVICLKATNSKLLRKIKALNYFLQQEFFWCFFNYNFGVNGKLRACLLFHSQLAQSQ